MVRFTNVINNLPKLIHHHAIHWLTSPISVTYKQYILLAQYKTCGQCVADIFAQNKIVKTLFVPFVLNIYIFNIIYFLSYVLNAVMRYSLSWMKKGERYNSIVVNLTEPYWGQIIYACVGLPCLCLNEKTGDVHASEGVLWRGNTTTLVWVPCWVLSIVHLQTRAFM